MTELDSVRRDLLALAGWPRALDPQTKIEVLGSDAYLITDEQDDDSWQDIPHMDFEWLFSLLPENVNVDIAYDIYAAPPERYEVSLSKHGDDGYIIGAAATRLHAFALVVRDYLHARAGNG